MSPDQVRHRTKLGSKYKYRSSYCEQDEDDAPVLSPESLMDDENIVDKFIKVVGNDHNTIDKKVKIMYKVVSWVCYFNQLVMQRLLNKHEKKLNGIFKSLVPCTNDNWQMAPFVEKI